MSQIPDSQIFTPTGPETDIMMNSVPSIPALFAKLISLSFVRPSSLEMDLTLKNVRMGYRAYEMDPGLISRFKAICGYESEPGNPRVPQVPAPYIQTLFIGIISRFISSSHFPINPMGLIQVGQSFVLKRPVQQGEPLDLYCRLLDMSQTPKGIHTRFQLTASAGREEVWQGIATYFTRAKNPPAKERSAPKEDILLPVKETIEVPANIGRQYAGVSRDYNPHHLYGWTARFIGFKQAIAHGIWSLARTGASLEKAFDYPQTLEMKGALKLPIFLPSTITLGYETLDENTVFELRNQEKGLPHLKGSFTF